MTDTTTPQLSDFTDPEAPEYNIDPRWVQEVRRGAEFNASRTAECMRASATSRLAATAASPERSARSVKRRRVSLFRRPLATN